MGNKYATGSSSGLASTRGRLRFWLVFTLIVAFLGVMVTIPKPFNNAADYIASKTPVNIPHFWDKNFKLGLDLQGGTHLEYNADTSKAVGVSEEEAINGVRDVIERRVNAIGVSEPLVLTTKVGDTYRIIVELAGVSDVKEAIKLIGETPLLEFREENTEPARDLTAQEKSELAAFNAKAKTKTQELLATAQKDATSFGDLVKNNSQDSGAIISNGGSLGAITSEHELYSFVKGYAAGKVIPRVFENDEFFAVVKLDEVGSQKEVSAKHILICYEGASRCEGETKLSKEEALAKITDLKTKATPANFVTLAKENSTEPGADKSGGDLGTFKEGMMVQAFNDVVMPQKVNTISDVVETEFGYHLIYKTAEKQVPTYTVSRLVIDKQTNTDYVQTEPFKNTQLNGSHLERAQVQFQGQTNEPVVGLVFNDEGAKLFEEITQKNLNKVVAIYLDGQIISAPRVQSVITNGEAVITGSADINENKLLAQRLNAGALPVPIELVSQQTIGATLGQQSVADSLKAGIYGFIFVACFMIFLYRLPGLLSVIALAFYAVVLLTLYKTFGVTLTLPGLAGVVLSLGIAVDANVLIFERLKEEVLLGKPYQSAVDEAFKRAWSSIRDGNASTLITTFILANVSTSFIRGFAITLAIGVMLSMFSAVIVTRLLMKLVIRNNFVHKFPKLCLSKPLQK